MGQILYSYPPGAGGDHVCGMLLNQPIRLIGQRVHTGASIKLVDHLVRTQQITIDHYLEQIEQVKKNSTIVVSHAVEIPGTENMIRVRAVWSDPGLTLRLIARDMMTCQWGDVVPYLDAEMHSLLCDDNISYRRRLLQFLKNQYQHGIWHHNEPFLQGWHRFYIDRIFTMDFVQDVTNLAKILDLEIDQNLVKANHETWLSKNPLCSFSVKKAVRYLENRAVLNCL